MKPNYERDVTYLSEIEMMNKKSRICHCLDHEGSIFWDKLSEPGGKIWHSKHAVWTCLETSQSLAPVCMPSCPGFKLGSIEGLVELLAVQESVQLLECNPATNFQSSDSLDGENCS